MAGPRAIRATASARRSARGSQGRIEEIFGWLKTIAGLRPSKFRGLKRVGMSFTFALAAYNLIRMPKLLAPSDLQRAGT